MISENNIIGDFSLMRILDRQMFAKHQSILKSQLYGIKDTLRVDYWLAALGFYG